MIKKLWLDESGISSVEYALLLSMVAAAIIVAGAELSEAVSNKMSSAADCIETNTPSLGC